ncbi:MAG: flagellar protein MotY [Candidatus Pelagadaptatus aseana]|uniref:flagellar protein MotY n=1 Tax=Candidatus Pelagadaptatus aseana TaxID=3120508 RepID=UPI0039B2EF67
MAAHSWAATYQTPMDESSWMVEGSIFECRMTHDIPFYGKGVFYKEAGEAATFDLKPSRERFKTGKASLVSEAPVWKPRGKNVNLGLVSVKQGKDPLTLEEARTERILAELLAGQKIVITRKPWYGAEQSSRVVLSSVNFTGAYRQFMECLATLLPVNFRQIERTAIYFPSGRDSLRPSELKKLEHIAVYVKADPSVQSFFIDGHTDAVGNRGENLELSKKRAEMVATILRQKGIPPDQIQVRWHGERYPVATNRTRMGRAQNRRVTIRLQKNGGPSVPELARN